MAGRKGKVIHTKFQWRILLEHWEEEMEKNSELNIIIHSCNENVIW
jgi:hypothetical protein